MKLTHKEYGDTADIIGSKNDVLSLIAFAAGLIGLLTFLWYLGVIADTIISLVEIV